MQHTLFPSIVHQLEVDNFQKDNLVKFVEDEKLLDPQGLQRTNKGGWHSHLNYYQYDNPISCTIVQALIKYFSNTEIFKDRFEFKIVSMWINVNEEGDYNSMHLHPNSNFSAVFWIKAPENSGRLEFTSPHGFTQNLEILGYSDKFRNNSNIHTSFYFEPTEGSILLFPASLYHEVSPSKSKENRISVAFNLNLC